MPDQSHLDSRYFVDENVFNCPFCNRRNVAYTVRSSYSFDWTEKKKCYVYFVGCHSCKNVSMHLSFTQHSLLKAGIEGHIQLYKFNLNSSDIDKLDSFFFYSVPTSFFVLDIRIPKTLRELMTEAEGCLKSNFLTGASACARKVVYELAVLQGATGESYEERIKSLKSIEPSVDPTFFDTLLTIQQVTSTKVHEQSYDGWEAKHLRLILSTLSEILQEIYVVPAIRDEKRAAILQLKDEVIGQRNKKKTDSA